MGALRHQLRGTCGGAWTICVCNLRPRFFPQCGAPLTNCARHAQWLCVHLRMASNAPSAAIEDGAGAVCCAFLVHFLVG